MAEEEVINPPVEEAPIANDAEVRKREREEIDGTVIMTPPVVIHA